ncbi:hypothetical protein ANH9381_0089 [Aggregatibacter actinomycetemcomitans ANH9381]|nr:hypothetical protein ANH9381_0089 [Aggregatibacter actinomycetemcomitans ANH9381]
MQQSSLANEDYKQLKENSLILSNISHKADNYAKVNFYLVKK